MCPSCEGLGVRHDFDPELLVPDPSLSVWDGAIAPIGPIKEIGKWRRHLFEGVAANFEADEDGPPKGTMLRGPWRDLAERFRKVWLYGAGDRKIVCHWKNKGRVWSHAEPWPGVATALLAGYQKAAGGPVRAQLEPYMRSMTCPDCQGSRLNARARAVRVGGKTLVQIGAMPIGQAARASSTPWPIRRINLLPWEKVPEGADEGHTQAILTAPPSGHLLPPGRRINRDGR